MSLTDRFGLDEARRRERQEFLDLTPDDAENVRQLRPLFDRFARDFAERFYAKLTAHPRLAEFFRDPAQLDRLKHLQTDYFARLLDGPYDADYFESRLRVGLAHQRVGVEPAWYLGMYNQYVQLAFPRFAEHFGEAGDVLPLLLSLVKVIFLDVGLALDTYFQEATRQVRQRNEELQQALALYWQTQRREEQLRKLISHEVRGGLGAVITTLEDLLERVRPYLDAGAAEELGGVAKRCWSLSNLLGEMLAPAESQAGPGWVDLKLVFAALEARFGLYAAGRNVKLELPTTAPKVWGDALHLREVFANLVGNAVNYMDKDAGTVAVTWKADGPFCAFAVRDNGPGIPPALRERLFEPFVRGPVANERHAGTGLGLYFVRTVVEQAGGKVWVESTPGQGSTFWFTLHTQPNAG
jgi:signal transduction histidine kinase